MSARKPYPSDVSDDEWALVAPYLTLLPEAAGQREHSLRKVFNGLRYVIKTGAPWRWMPNDLPPWAAVYQQAQRWLAAGCFEALTEDLRAVLRRAAGRTTPSARMARSCTWRSIRWAICWRCTSRLPAQMTALRLGAWRKLYRSPPGRASN